MEPEWMTANVENQSERYLTNLKVNYIYITDCIACNPIAGLTLFSSHLFVHLCLLRFLLSNVCINFFARAVTVLILQQSVRWYTILL